MSTRQQGLTWFTKASVSDCDFAPAVGVLPLVIDAIGKSIVGVALPVAARAFGIARLKLADVAFESLGTGAIKLRRAHGGFAGAAVETGLRIAFVRDLEDFLRWRAREEHALIDLN